jgi:hypothetical protein
MVMPVLLLDGVSESELPVMVTAAVLVESKLRDLIAKACPSVVVKFAAVGFDVTKWTSVVAPGSA